MNDKFTKDIDSTKRYQTEIGEVKNYIEFINGRNEQCEGRVSEIKDKMVNHDELLREGLKTIKEQENFIQQL